MNARIAAIQQLLDRPVSFTGRILLLGAIVVLLAGAALPLWRISLVAPQYAEGLSLDMYAYQIVAGNNGQDLAEIVGHRLAQCQQADHLRLGIALETVDLGVGLHGLHRERAVLLCDRRQRIRELLLGEPAHARDDEMKMAQLVVEGFDDVFAGGCHGCLPIVAGAQPNRPVM